MGAHFSVIFGSKAFSCAFMNEQMGERIRIKANFFTVHSFMAIGITKTEIFYSALFAEAIKKGIKKPVARNGPH